MPLPPPGSGVPGLFPCTLLTLGFSVRTIRTGACMVPYVIQHTITFVRGRPQQRSWAQVYVSRGIGMVCLPVRFLARSEVAILELVPPSHYYSCSVRFLLVGDLMQGLISALFRRYLPPCADLLMDTARSHHNLFTSWSSPHLRAGFGAVLSSGMDAAVPRRGQTRCLNRAGSRARDTHRPTRAGLVRHRSRLFPA